MNITTRLFAAFREKAGTSEVALALPNTATVSDALAELTLRYPSLLDGIPTMIAVNAEYVQESHPLQDGDEVALIPPVSGGALPRLVVGQWSFTSPHLWDGMANQLVEERAS